MRVILDERSIQVRLRWWQRMLGLMRDIVVPLPNVADVRFVEDPISEAMGSGLKVGLRLPWLYFIARTIRLDRAFLVRRGVPALAFAVNNQPPLEHVLVSTPDARELAERLQAAG